ncbi:DUF2145 domain-containing protein [Roseateles puraquae]|uniref:DUF2145 domain-containing protein n=1 Tax=Roseateles puraquae TaxID=431059 RepID=A0A254N8R6_9BURK|nr:DUF2145 domain-containing protein [Roseateles puraquae]MDG0854965.1 DUF2145 domain-containing protein [Roseateles puraquae]OWR04409.1 hypothetical protein CDO81_07405 [Roseateles puraquae]
MKRALAAAALALTLAAPAHAGRSCEEKPPSTAQVEQGLRLAEATLRALDASGADVAVLARAGQDLSKYGLRWSHLGLAYRQDGVWRVVHKLNHCGTDQAAVYRQGLGEFFLDNPFRYEAAFVVLKPELQQALLPVLADNTRVARFHEPRYSMVAYAFGTRYQQSNQWALETLAGAAAPGVVSRRAAQDWLQHQGYEPTDLHLSTLTRLGGRLTRANIAFDDHPSARRFSSHIDTVTVDSMFAWLQRTGLSQAPQLVPQ